MVLGVELTYKFNNDEKQMNITRLEYLQPEYIEIYAREGDTLYVSDGDSVYVNQLIKDSTSGIKTYATVSGVVSINGDVIRITNDKEDSTYTSEQARDKIEDVKKDEIIDACEELGIEFENKLIVNKLKNNSKILIVNGMDVEPYQFNSNYLFQENAKALLDTISLLSKRFNIDAYLLLSKYDDNNVSMVKTMINSYTNINFKVINDAFPFNTNPLIAKKFFNEYKDEDIMFLDTMSLYKIYYAIKEGLPVSTRYVTVCSPNEDKAYVILTKYGASLGEMVKNTIGETAITKDIFLNNFLRKVKCVNLGSLIVSDTIKSIFLMEHTDNPVLKCINCGKCVDICPVKINPMDKKLDPACIRCGLCNFVCPANINLIDKEK